MSSNKVHQKHLEGEHVSLVPSQSSSCLTLLKPEEKMEFSFHVNRAKFSALGPSLSILTFQKIHQSHHSSPGFYLERLLSLSWDRERGERNQLGKVVETGFPITLARGCFFKVSKRQSHVNVSPYSL